jgi:hypothetical protein
MLVPALEHDALQNHQQNGIGSYEDAPKAPEASQSATSTDQTLLSLFNQYFPAASNSKQKANFEALMAYLEDTAGLELCFFKDSGISEEQWRGMVAAGLERIASERAAKIPDVVGVKVRCCCDSGASGSDCAQVRDWLSWLNRRADSVDAL